MTKSITQVWAPQQQALAQCPAIEWTKAEVAVRNVVVPTPHPEQTSRLKGANVRWCVATKRPIRSNSFTNGRFAITFANEVGSYAVLYEAVTKLLRWTAWQVSDRVLRLMVDLVAGRSLLLKLVKKIELVMLKPWTGISDDLSSCGENSLQQFAASSCWTR